MKKTVKIILWSLAGLLLLIVVAVGVLVNVVVTPSRLTPIVRDMMPNYLTCQADVDEVELTYFSTFPDFCFRLHNFTLVNPMEGAPSDTLLSLQNLEAVVNLSAWFDNEKIDIKAFHLSQGVANLYLSADSVANYDVFVSSDTPEDTTSVVTIDEISLHQISFDGISATYVDETVGMRAAIQNLTAAIEGESRLQKPQGDIDLNGSLAGVQYADSAITLDLQGLELPSCKLNVDGMSNFGANLSTKIAFVAVNMAGADPLQTTLRGIDVSNGELTIRDNQLQKAGAEVSLDSLALAMSGSTNLALQLGRTTLQLPHAEAIPDYSAQFKADVAAVTFDMKPDGRLLNHLPMHVESTVKAKADLSEIHLSETSFRAAQEALKLRADVLLPDSITTKVDTHVELLPTTISRLLALVPKAYRQALTGIDVNGKLGTLTADASVQMVGNEPLAINALQIDTRVTDLSYREGKKMQAALGALDFSASYPVENTKMESIKQKQQAKRQKATNTRRRSSHAKRARFMSARLSGEKIHFSMDDSMQVVADLPKARFNGTFSDEILADAQSLPFIAADFAFDQLKAQVDTIALATHDLSGSMTMADGMRGMKKYYEASFECADVDIAMGKSLHAQSGPLQLDASSVYDHQQEDLLLRYNPLLNVSLEKGNVEMAEVPYPLEFPAIDFDFNLGRFIIRDGRLNYGNSDFKLTGEVLHLREYLKKESDLKADLKLKSRQTDVYQLMDLAEQLVGPADSTAVAQSDATVSADPFMVPEAIDLKLQTTIDRTLVGENIFNNLGGQLSIKDANLVLEEMGFSSKAARMQLTALYRSPKKDNLFVGANFHLLDIEVADLIKMIPEIDTIVPMLRSFEGKAEFHLAAETNLFGNYDVKMSTLKATAAVEGKDLVLLDGETFSTISKYLMFNKKTRNNIDTLSVEMAVNRRKATVYPMLIGMDKYQAVISGNHDLTGAMPFNYHVSITDCPVVGGHLGLDIEGDLDDPEAFTYKLVGCKYASLYKPEKRNITQAQTLELKSLIANALKRTVKEQAKAEDNDLKVQEE